MDMTRKAKTICMILHMHDLYVLTKLKFANQTMAIYGDYSVAQYVLSLYTNRVLLIFPYASGVSVPTEE